MAEIETDLTSDMRRFVGPSGPVARTSYAYALNLCPSDLAWEFLRRNRDYQRDYQLGRRGADPVRRLACGRYLTRLRRLAPQCEHWELYVLVDPKAPAPLAPLCWRVSTAAPILDGVAERAGPEAAFALSISRCAAAGHIIVAPSGEELILFRDAERAATLRLEGARASLGPVHVTYLIRNLPDPHQLADRFRRLTQLIASPRPEARPSRLRLFLRDALFALDARQLGMSQREIASALYGAEATRSGWSSSKGSIRERIRHLLARGQELSDGGYRRLLQEGG
jgi:hypothetical protein